MSKLLLDPDDYQKFTGRDFGKDFLKVPVKSGKFYDKQSVSNEIRQLVFARDGFTCSYCGSTENLSIDHILAESKGGKTIADNLQTLCRSCNSRKGAK